uniref:Exonuclease 3'-5' domain-containing protein 1 n=1 Tax=Rhipicephalus zambeziensis TaxID=60191 RepID=A0A224YSX7_9ACAR
MSSIASKWLSPDLQGCRVLLRMNEGNSVEGVVADVSQKTSRITLDQVSDASMKQPLFGQLHFYAQEISSCVVLDNSTRKKYILQRDEDGPRLLRVRPVPAHLEKLNAAQNNSEFICHREETDPSEVIKKGIIKLIGTPDDLPRLRRPIATDFEVIDEVNDQLREAIAAIRKEQTISVAFEGVKVGRHGPLSVLAVATSSKVYVFDVQKMKKELFDHGLKEIFESDEIEKIIHGCRHLSDCLHHHYQVGLNNVFDTMVADVIIYLDKKLEAGDCQLPSYVRGIQNCLRSFLNLSYDQLKYTRSRQGSQEDEVCAWGQRPLSLRQIDALVKDVVYLGELARVCLKLMLQKFHLGVEFFLGLDRDCSEEELRCLPLDHILPVGFRDALKLSANRAAPNRTYSSYDEDCYREYGHHARRNNNRHYHHRDNLRRGRGFSAMNNDRVHSRQQRDSYRQEESNRKRDDRNNVKEDNCVEDSLLYVAMHQQTNGTSRELSDPKPDTAQKSNVGEQSASIESATQEEKPATSVLQDHCPVANGNEEDAQANRVAMDEPHPNTSPRSLELSVEFPAPRCSSTDNGVNVSQWALSQHCNRNGPSSSVPSDNHDRKHHVNVVTAEHPSDDTLLALPETLMEHCNGSTHRIVSMRDKPLVQSLSPPHVEHQQGVFAESTPVPRWNHESNPTTEAAVSKKGAPKTSSCWGNRPVNENAEGISFRPADMNVSKDSA